MYVNSGTKIKCKCLICNTIWNPYPRDILREHGCPTCSHKRGGSRRRKGHDDFISELAKVSPDIIVEGKYCNSKTKVACRCKKCGYVWNPIPNSLLSGKGCPNCAGRPQKDTKSFVKELSEKQPDIQVLGEYKNSRTPIKVRCRICGKEWETSPKSLLRGRSHKNATSIHSKLG